MWRIYHLNCCSNDNHLITNAINYLYSYDNDFITNPITVSTHYTLVQLSLEFSKDKDTPYI